MNRPLPPVGRALKRWRKLRGLSQLDLSLRSGVGARHLSFIETGRSRPGQEVVLRLAEALSLPLREQNDLLRAAGLPPYWPEQPLESEALAPWRQVVRQLLDHYEPWPAYALDRWWDVVMANRTGRQLFMGGAERVNAVETVLSPWFRAAVENHHELVAALVARLRAQVRSSPGDARLEELLTLAEAQVSGPVGPDVPVVCSVLRVGRQRVRLLSTIARFGATSEVALEELRVELVVPADEESADFLRGVVG